jgi:hypothetical protein
MVTLGETTESHQTERERERELDREEGSGEK